MERILAISSSRPVNSCGNPGREFRAVGTAAYACTLIFVVCVPLPST